MAFLKIIYFELVVVLQCAAMRYQSLGRCQWRGDYWWPYDGDCRVLNMFIGATRPWGWLRLSMSVMPPETGANLKSKQGWGVGARIKTPAGPIALDCGLRKRSQKIPLRFFYCNRILMHHSAHASFLFSAMLYSTVFHVMHH